MPLFGGMNDIALLTFFTSIFWLIIFFFAKNLRKEMLILGICSLFLLPFLFRLNSDVDILDILFQELIFLDFVFVFLLAGMAGAIFHLVFGRHYHLLPRRLKKTVTKKDSIVQLWFFKLFILLLSFSWATLALHIIFDISMPISIFLAALMVAIYFVSHRHDLLFDAILSGVLLAFTFLALSFFIELFVQMDIIYAFHSTQDFILVIFAMGMLLGPLYEYVRGLELRSYE